MMPTSQEATIRLAGHRRAVWLLAIVAYLDGFILPCPPEVVLLPLVLAQPRRVVLLTAVCIGASVLGAATGYAVGAHLYADLGRPILAVFGSASELERFATLYADHGAWAVLVTGLTPFPDKVAAVMAGASNLPVAGYVAMSLAARTLRFALTAGLLWRFGAPIRDFIQTRLGLVSR